LPNRFPGLLITSFSHAAENQMRCVQVQYKCQGTSLLVPLSLTNQNPLCRRPSRSAAKRQKEGAAKHLSYGTGPHTSLLRRNENSDSRYSSAGRATKA
jgi:hypothetical protein